VGAVRDDGAGGGADGKFYNVQSSCYIAITPSAYRQSELFTGQIPFPLPNQQR